MDEKKELKLKVLERTVEQTESIEESKNPPKYVHPNQTNPILKHLGRFRNEQIGSRFSLRDLLR